MISEDESEEEEELQKRKTGPRGPSTWNLAVQDIMVKIVYFISRI